MRNKPVSRGGPRSLLHLSVKIAGFLLATGTAMIVSPAGFLQYYTVRYRCFGVRGKADDPHPRSRSVNRSVNPPRIAIGRLSVGKSGPHRDERGILDGRSRIILLLVPTCRNSHSIGIPPIFEYFAQIPEAAAVYDVNNVEVISGCNQLARAPHFHTIALACLPCPCTPVLSHTRK
jgi:hypothetical protein